VIRITVPRMKLESLSKLGWFIGISGILAWTATYTVAWLVW